MQTGRGNNQAEQPTGLVFDIQRFSVHDGPGIRTTVFFKGCNLRCFWCHNPESYSPRPQLSVYPDKCVGCGRCVAACAYGCHTTADGVKHAVDLTRCAACGACAKVCVAGSLVMVGKSMTVARIMKTVAADAPFYKNSGGGLTCSGGEPLLQADFVAQLLRAAKEAGIHTALDTAGNLPYEVIQQALPYADLVLFDCKAMDEAAHERVTGVSNKRILENLGRLAREGIPIWVRTPVIPGTNDTMENMREEAEFLSGLPGVKRLDLLPYHSLGAGKYRSLGMELDPSKVLTAPPKSEMERLAKAFEGADYELVVN
ncbi:MAG: glycyl-radical enzyme activating protein [Oscillospiraceae bacterium]|jgi:pyruvate formate lyase activating enzyme|nr:glycyl-radical enzyme activating protein [Oscillospiraceae bacterium]